MKRIKQSWWAFQDLENITDYTGQTWGVDQALIALEDGVSENYGWFLKNEQSFRG